jgi:hypothetical protein
MTLRRIPDARVKQFWDPSHLVSQELSRIARERPGQPLPACCTQKGVIWDEAILYQPQAKWESGPSPAFMNGPVVKVASGLENAINAQR